MKYGFFPKTVWKLFEKSYKKQLKKELHEPKRGSVMKAAKKRYKEIVDTIDEFDKGDRFLFNTLSCAMLASILLSVSNHYTVSEITSFYSKTMNIKTVRKSAKKTKVFTSKGREKLKLQAKNSELSENPYATVFEIEDGENLNEYTASFKSCGICHLMKELNLEDYIPAICSFEYDMAMMEKTELIRQTTLASGGSCCDCHYIHNGKLKK